MSEISVKARRLLDHLGVSDAMKRGAQRIAVGPLFELRREPGIFVRLMFERDAGELNIGYVKLDGPEWEVVESEIFSLRALGYYERWLKRHGDFSENRDLEILA